MPARYILGVHSKALVGVSTRIIIAYSLLCALSDRARPDILNLRFVLLLALVSSPTFSLLHLLSLPALLPYVPKHIRLIGTLVACLVAWRKHLPEPYGLFHVELNEGNAEWGNMGLWVDGDPGFERAAERLALKVVSAGRCTKKGKVLDVGHGTGDSLLLHLNHPAVPRPSLLAGITSVPIQHTRSSDRCLRTFEKPSGGPPTLRLFCGDAISRPRPFAPVIFGCDSHAKCHEHPLYWDSSFPLFDNILSIDSAYHYETRSLFFAQAFRRLAPGGTLALGDVCFALFPTVTPVQALVRASLAALMAVPAQNVVSPGEYVRQLQRLGFEDVQLEDITSSVFPGFAKYLSRQPGKDWRFFANVIRLWQWSGARFVIVSARKPGGNPSTEPRIHVRMPPVEIIDEDEDDQDE